MPEPSGRAARRPRRAKWILGDCWCMRLQAIAAILFVYYLHCIIINVWGKDIFHLQKNLVKEYNDSMLKASKDFNRSLRSLRRVRHWLTSTSRRPGGRGPRPGPRGLFDLGDIPPRFFRVFSNTPRVAAAPQNVDNPAGYFGHKRFRRAFEDRAVRRKMGAKQTERQTRTSSKGRRGAALPAVGRAMGALLARLSGAARGRLTRLVEAVCAMGMVMCVATMVAAALLVVGVVNNDPKLVLPWLAVAGYFGLFNLIYFACKLGVRVYVSKAKRAGVVVGMVLLILLVTAIVLLFIYTVLSFFYLIFTTPLFLHYFRNTAQLVVMDNEEGGTDSAQEDKPWCGSSRRPWRRN